MSMIGLAARPGTDVEPQCATRRARWPSVSRIIRFSRRNAWGHAGSWSTSVMGPSCGRSSPTWAARISSSLITTLLDRGLPPWYRCPAGLPAGRLHQYPDQDLPPREPECKSLRLMARPPPTGAPERLGRGAGGRIGGDVATTEHLRPDVSAAHDALRAHRWEEAFGLLSKADADAEAGLQPEDLEALAQAAWFSAKADLALEAKERAFAGYLDRGGRPRAAFLAFDIAREYWNQRKVS